MMNPSNVRVPLLTPYGKEGEIAFDTLAQHVEYLRSNGINDYFLSGTTGEVAVNNNTERMELIERIPHLKKGDEFWVVGTGHRNAHTATDLTRYASRFGADAAIVVTPDFWGSKDDYEKYFSRILGLDPEMDIHICASPAGSHLTTGFIEKMAERYGNLRGVKSGNLQLLLDIQDRLKYKFEASCEKNQAEYVDIDDIDFVGERVELSCGNDKFMYAAASNGLSVTSGWANCFPAVVKYIVTRCVEEPENAERLQDALGKLIRNTMESPSHFGDEKPHPVALQKAAFKILPGEARKIKMGQPKCYKPVPRSSMRYLGEQIETFLSEVESVGIGNQTA
jgi:dihydrodipicolinate synthase/N-acetylneuraminate lyase